MAITLSVCFEISILYDTFQVPGLHKAGYVPLLKVYSYYGLHAD